MSRHPESLIKCKCGKVMRLKNWAEHFKGCNRGQAALSGEDINTFLVGEAKKEPISNGQSPQAV